MPPIKVELSIGKGEKRRLPNIEPGGLPGSFTDGKDTVVVSCTQDDAGGFVSRHVGKAGLVMSEGRLRVLDNVSDVEAVIPDGGTYEMSVDNPKVGRVALTFTHYHGG